MAIVIMNLKMYQELDFESNHAVEVVATEAGCAAESCCAAVAAEAGCAAEAAEATEAAEVRARINATVSSASEPAKATQIVRLERFVK